MQYPISEEYPAVYRDRHGEEHTVLRNDGKNLAMTVRGVEFTGQALDDFEPATGTDPVLLNLFTFNQHSTDTMELCDFEIVYTMSILMVAHGQDTTGILTVQLVLGAPTERGSLGREHLNLNLCYEGQTYSSRGTSGWFEDEMLHLQAALPEGVSLKACITCGLSDYSPYGHGMFGSLTCFRDNKEVYRKVSDKIGLFLIWDTHTESVQETYCCPEFEQRKPGAGYRG